jgi:aldehyde dehydrogenase (NAD+)
VETAGTEGGTVLTPVPDFTDHGLFMAPRVVTDVQPEHTVAQEEIFGPVVSVIAVDDLDEAIEVTNGVRYGLAASVCTTSLSSAYAFVRRAKAGLVKVNRPTSGLDLNAPFGGIKDSSSNSFREQGPAAIEFYTWQKSVYLGHE